MHLVRSTSFADQHCFYSELDTALKRDVVERTTFPMYTRNIEIKCKLSDLEVVFTNSENQLPITGYIQLERQDKIESGSLCRCPSVVESG